jgi:hypothetical protein
MDPISGAHNASDRVVQRRSVAATRVIRRTERVPHADARALLKTNHIGAVGFVRDVETNAVGRGIGHWA